VSKTNVIQDDEDDEVEDDKVTRLLTTAIFALALAGAIGFSGVLSSGSAEAANADPGASMGGPVTAADSCLTAIGLPDSIGIGTGLVVNAPPLVGVSIPTIAASVNLPDACAVVPTALGIVTGVTGGLPLPLPIPGTQ